MEEDERRGLQPDEIIEWCMADGIAEALVNGEVMSRDEANEIEDKIRQDRVEEVRTALGIVVADKHQEIQRELTTSAALSKRINKFTYGHRSRALIPGFDKSVEIPQFSLLTPNRIDNDRSQKTVKSELRKQFESYVPEAHINVLGRIVTRLYMTQYRNLLEGFEDARNALTYDGADVDAQRYEQWRQALGTETSKTFLTLLARMTEGK